MLSADIIARIAEIPFEELPSPHKTHINAITELGHHLIAVTEVVNHRLVAHFRSPAGSSWGTYLPPIDLHPR